MSQDPGRREAAKAATRAALQDAARRLFAQRGFTGTTVQAIAEAAGVTERTFFRYFGSKDELLADLVLGGLPVLQAAIVARPPSEAPLVAVRNAMLTTVGSGLSPEGQPAVARLFEDGPPGLRLKHAGAHLLLRLESAISDALQERMRESGGASSDLEMRADVLASAAVAATRRALMRNGMLMARGEASRPELARLITAAFDVLLSP